MEDAALMHFRSADPVLYALSLRTGPVALRPSDDHFLRLAESVVCQQLSEKAGATIWNRFLALFAGVVPDARAITVRTAEEIRSCGVSGAKAGYIRNVADAFLNGTVTPGRFGSMTDEDIVSQLMSIKGVGRWTAEMFLIFSLGRPDVFSMGDVGLQNAMIRAYARPGRRLSARRMTAISRRWRPFRSYACLILWKSLSLPTGN